MTLRKFSTDSHSNPSDARRKNFQRFTVNGREICRHFNRLEGCNLPDCKFAHLCNLSINNKACGQNHPSRRHDYACLGYQNFKSFLNTESWLEELKGDPNEEFLSDGIINGFQVIPDDARLVPAEMNSYI